MTAMRLAACILSIAVACGATAGDVFVDGNGVLREEGGREIAVWGVNYYPPFSIDYHAIKDKGLDHKAVMREDMAHFKLMGVDVLRLHCFDRQISDAEGRFLDNEHVELLDYLIALAATNGIKTVLTPIAWWWAKSGDGFSSRHTMRELVGNRALWPVQQRYLREFVAHRNRYTGFTYGEDPAVLFFECINEPLYEKDARDEDVTAYADALASALRTGTKKPVFYNSWLNKNKAVGASSVDGVTGSYYPTGLLAGKELAGPLLASLRESTLHPDSSIAKKAKVIYEFDAADTEGAYFYPAFAKLFRHEGAQMAAMFQYDPVALADENRNWQTHHLNLVYTPRKAVSFLIGGEAFRRLKRGCAFESSERGMAFGPFKVDAFRDLSEMATEKEFMYTGDTSSVPPAPKKLEKVVGVGRSSVVCSSGTGAYFLRRIENGRWRLELFPSVMKVANPFSGKEGAKFVKSPCEMELAVHLPDLGEGFVVRMPDERRAVGRAVDGRVLIAPGKYDLVRRDISGDSPDDVEFLDVDDALQHAAWKHGLKKSWWISLSAAKDERGRPALRSTVKANAFNDEFPAEHLRLHRDATPLSVHFPGLRRGKAVRVHARALGDKSMKVELALVMPGGYAWGTNVELTPEWRDIEVPIGKFRYFIQWGLAKPDGMELDLGRISAINFCLGRWLLGGAVPSEGFEVSMVQPVFGNGEECMYETDAMKPFPVLRPVPERLSDARRGFQSAPSITVAPKGRLWVAWHTGDTTEGDENGMVVVSSGDSGDTWTPPLFAIDPPGPLRILDPGLWTDPDGKVWLFYAQLYGMWDGRAGVWAMHPLDPEDANTGWTPARRLCHGYLKNKPIIMRDGTWLLPCEFMNCKPWGGRIGDVRSVPKEFTFEMPEYRAANVFASKDKGKTVTFLGNAQVPPKDRDCTENMVVERRDGTLWMLVRVKYGIAETFSSDGGKTWSELRPSAILNPNSRFFIGRLKSGAMLLVKNGPVGKKMGRSHITAFVSDDDGATWLGGLVLDERNHVSYPDAVEGPDGFIHVVHDRERTKAREIMHHRFTEADVRAGRLVTPGSRLKGIVNKAGPKSE